MATAGDGEFWPLDREADRAFSALFRAVDALHTLFEADVVANEPAGRTALEAATTLLAILDTHDRGLVQLPSRQQFDAMTRVLLSLEPAPAKAALNTLALGPAVVRLSAITKAYGTRLGLLAERAGEGPEAAALAAFEGALERTLVHIDSEHDEDTEDDRRVRALTLGVYEEAVTAQRTAEAEARRKARKNKTPEA